MKKPNRFKITSLVKTRFLFSALLSFQVFALIPSLALAQSTDFPNPYYTQTEWVVWESKGRQTKDLPADFEIAKRSKRLFPVVGKWLEFGSKANDRAGFWDDIHVSQDNFHARLPKNWKFKDSPIVDLSNATSLKRPYFGFQIEKGKLISPALDELKKIGASFTSQSTTGLGHDIANHPAHSLVTESGFYFANTLRCGPAHSSFIERSETSTIDAYEALNPSFFNSIGSSGSETWAIAKMMIAGSYLKRDLKQSIKEHGIYPATMLYIWKAGLPYEVEYENELRHRVAYYSKGDFSNYTASNRGDFNFWGHAYDEEQHLRNMIKIATELEAAPPISILSKVTVKTGEAVYATRTAVLARQPKDSDVEISFSTSDSYDLASLPLKIEVSLLNGNPDTKIEDLGDGKYRVVVPYNAKLPKGRTSVLIVASNGESKSNPAVINVFNQGAGTNKRPTLVRLPQQVVLPGEEISFDLKANDPEGFPVKFYRPAGEVGNIENGQFKWTATKPGVYPVTLIASDSTTGSGLSSFRSQITVQNSVAEIVADQVAGEALFSVKLSGEKSRDAKPGKVFHRWSFDDGSKQLRDSETEHTFQAGLYEIQLDAIGGSKEMASTTVWVESKAPAAKTKSFLDPALLEKSNPSCPFEIAKNDDPELKIPRRKKRGDAIDAVTTKQEFKAPFGFHISYKRSRDNTGAGIKFAGAFIGNMVHRPAFSDDGNDNSIALLGQLESAKYLLRQPRFPAKDTKLKVYVMPDPKNSGKWSIRGHISNEVGDKYFRLDNCDPTVGPITYMAGNRGGSVIREFEVWN